MIIAVAKDEAFNFTYRANIDAMKVCGKVVFFSPLSDQELPKCDMLYLPGGYPELFAEMLEQNASMRHSIHQYVEQGGFAFAECGGMMYLTNSISIDGKSYAMCDVFPFLATMENAHLHLGYRCISTDNDTLKGHEFHYSEVKENANSEIQITQNQLSAKGKEVATSIYRYKNVFAGYTHWYWAEKGFENFLNNFNVFF